MRDKYAYETASEMYMVAETAPFDNVAAQLIAEISGELRGNTLLEDDKIWNNLQKLEPYRKSQQVQEAISYWLSLINLRANNAKFEDAGIRTAYLEKDFDKVIERSRQALQVMPNNGMVTYAIRSNMALALMHQKKDLCAQLELEMVRKMSQAGKNPFFPALINLTVLYERLGKRAEAEALAKEVLEYAQKEEITVPIINFNRAWYMDLEYQNKKADKDFMAAPTLKEKVYNPKIDEIFDKIFDVTRSIKQSDAKKYQTFIKHIRSDYRLRSVFQIGLMGKLGFFDSWWRTLLGILVFIAACILYWIIFVGIKEMLINEMPSFLRVLSYIAAFLGFLFFIWIFLGTTYTGYLGIGLLIIMLIAGGLSSSKR